MKLTANVGYVATDGSVVVVDDTGQARTVPQRCPNGLTHDDTESQGYCICENYSVEL